jgi:hypothetical protein
LPIYLYVQFAGTSDKVTGVKTDNVGDIDFSSVELK